MNFMVHTERLWHSSLFCLFGGRTGLWFVVLLPHFVAIFRRDPGLSIKFNNKMTWDLCREGV
jgi:hypothetical protein